MSALRQALYGVALLGALALLIWGLQQRAALANTRAEQAFALLERSQEQTRQVAIHANTLAQKLSNERKAQANLRAQQDQLRQGLANRERTIEALKRENTELRIWSDQRLPDAARRLRERPALTGADAYRQWLSGRSAVPPASDGTGQ
jgi:LysB family phage lysis regulatory protein